MQPQATEVAIGIDAAVVADHRVVVRRPAAGGRGEILDDFGAAPTLSGLEQLAKRLAAYPGALAVAEPTSMTWLPLSVALQDATISLALLGNRHAGRLRAALAGKDKSDVIDAEVLSRAGEIFALAPARIPDPRELALRRAAQRRHKAVVDANRWYRRLLSLARWAFPDVWLACGGSRATALAVLSRWPHLGSLGRARLATITDVVAAHTRGVRNAGRRAGRIQEAARGWAAFWEGRLDLDALAWETTELLGDLESAEDRVARAEEEATHRWEDLWGDDIMLRSVPGMGPRTAPTVRAFLAEGRQFGTAKQAQAFVGLNPSNWSSGQVIQPSRAITKEGPEELRLAFYQAANVARTLDPQLADFYRRLMCERGHCHTEANCGVARKLVARTWATLVSGTPYELRDLEGNPITRRQAKDLARSLAVPEEVRRRARARSVATRRGRLTR
ncbi:MAG: transposase [Acidimicrobiia bacterium]